MTAHLIRWARGEIPLARTFWLYAIGYGALANLIATAAAFGVLAAGGTGLLALAVFLLPVPYNVLGVIAVWRSADRHDGDPRQAMAARIAIIAWAIFATFA